MRSSALMTACGRLANKALGRLAGVARLHEVPVLKSKWLGSLILIPIVAMVDWQLLASAPWWYVMWLVTPAAGLTMLIAGRRRRRPQWPAIGLVLILAGVIGGALAWFLFQNQQDANRHRCEQVAAAVEQHRSARGIYPKRVEDLVPDFLTELPSISVGILSTSLLYSASDEAASFAVGYRPMCYVALFYSKGEWSALPCPW